MPLQTQVRFEELPQVIWHKSLPSILTPGNVDIWRFNLASYLHRIQDLYKLLGAEEKARAGRFSKENDRERFIVSKACLRLLLGKYLSLKPRDISFEHSVRRKPRVKNPCNLSIHFNVSYSGECILIGVSDEEIGIDVELYGKAAVTKTEMDHLFIEPEVSSINNQNSPVKAFHNLWTRKEALLKATSQGISDEIRLVPCLNGTHVMNSGVIKSSKNWSVFSFDACEFCSASIAYSGLNKNLTFNELEDIK